MKIVSIFCVGLFLLSGNRDVSPDFIPDPNANDLSKQINALIQGYESNGYSGAIYVSTYGKGRTLFLEDYFSDNDEINGSTLFGIASVNKFVTALAIYKLIETDKLNLSTTLQSIFPDTPEDKRNITIYQLLTHTSGFADDYIMEGETDKERARSKLFNFDLSFKPSEKFGYSNDAYNLLAIIIENISGGVYEEFVKENVLVPLEMKNTFFWKDVIQGKINEHSIASTAESFPQEWMVRNWGFVGSGGMFLTLQDLGKLADAFNSRVSKVIQESSLSNLVNPVTEIESKSMGTLGVASGCFRGNNNEKLIEYIASGSEDYGHNAIIRYFPERNLKIVIMANKLRTTEGEVVSKKIAADIFALFAQDPWLRNGKKTKG